MILLNANPISDAVLSHKLLVGSCPRMEPVSTSDFRLPYINLLTPRQKKNEWSRKSRRRPTADVTKSPQGPKEKRCRGGRRSTGGRNVHQISLGRFLPPDLLDNNHFFSWKVITFPLGLKLNKVLYLWTPIILGFVSGTI